MAIKALSFFAAVTSALSVGGCDFVQSPTERPTMDAQAPVQSDEAKANFAWDELMSSSDLVEKKIGESSFTNFMRRVELSNQRRRELGLAFWDRYQDDQRRYSWFILAVGLSPSYPVDTLEWARNELHPGENPALIDQEPIARWNARYQALRDAFWAAPEVTDQQRRLVWYFELKEKASNLSEANAELFVDEVLAFASQYREPFGERDFLQYQYIIAGLSQALAQDALSLIRRGNVVPFEEKVSAIGKSENTLLANTLSSILSTSAPESLEQKAPEFVHTIELGWEALPRASGFDYQTEEGVMILALEGMIRAEKLRAMGIELWKSEPNRKMQFLWLIATLDSPSRYVVDIENAIQHYANNDIYNYAYDQGERASWDAIYATLRAETLDHPETTDEDRASLLEYELWFALSDAQRQWFQNGESVVSETIFPRVFQLYTDHEIVHSVTFHVILREPHKFGLSDKELAAFFERVEAFDNEELRGFVQAYRANKELRDSPFEFQATTMHGDDFDVASLRGKIVLVDHWGTGCASCIGAMPLIDEIYQRYKDRGFEVVSIAYDGTSERDKILRIEGQLGLTWTSLDGEGQWERVKQRYGYQGFPQYMLLNRDGTLFAGTGRVDMGRGLEELLQEMLAGEAVGEP